MRKIQVKFSDDAGSIIYDLDVDNKSYTSSKLNNDGTVEVSETGSITNPGILATRIRTIIYSVLSEQPK